MTINDEIRQDQDLKRRMEMHNKSIIMGKLAVRNCQYEIAINCLNAILEIRENYSTNIAQEALRAMNGCLPDNEIKWNTLISEYTLSMLTSQRGRLYSSPTTWRLYEKRKQKVS